ncbi:hypothetical protein P8452_70454 [Trifolium repens]|nr:hypothetical protein P8452_70454 [Trifolium repens]
MIHTKIDVQGFHTRILSIEVSYSPKIFIQGFQDWTIFIENSNSTAILFQGFQHGPSPFNFPTPQHADFILRVTIGNSSSRTTTLIK